MDDESEETFERSVDLTLRQPPCMLDMLAGSAYPTGKLPRRPHLRPAFFVPAGRTSPTGVRLFHVLGNAAGKSLDGRRQRLPEGFIFPDAKSRSRQGLPDESVAKNRSWKLPATLFQGGNLIQTPLAHVDEHKHMDGLCVSMRRIAYV